MQGTALNRKPLPATATRCLSPRASGQLPTPSRVRPLPRLATASHGDHSPQGAATAVPAGHRTEVLLTVGVGITSTVLKWGGSLLQFHGKAPTAADANVHVARLGYSAVGHYFCENHPETIKLYDQN